MTDPEIQPLTSSYENPVELKVVSICPPLDFGFVFMDTNIYHGPPDKR